MSTTGGELTKLEQQLLQEWKEQAFEDMENAGKRKKSSKKTTRKGSKKTTRRGSKKTVGDMNAPVKKRKSKKRKSKKTGGALITQNVTNDNNNNIELNALEDIENGCGCSGQAKTGGGKKEGCSCDCEKCNEGKGKCTDCLKKTKPTFKVGPNCPRTQESKSKSKSKSKKTGGAKKRTSKKPAAKKSSKRKGSRKGSKKGSKKATK